MPIGIVGINPRKKMRSSFQFLNPNIKWSYKKIFISILYWKYNVVWLKSTTNFWLMLRRLILEMETADGKLITWNEMYPKFLVMWSSWKLKRMNCSQSRRRKRLNWGRFDFSRPIDNILLEGRSYSVSSYSSTYLDGLNVHFNVPNCFFYWNHWTSIKFISHHHIIQKKKFLNFYFFQ